MGWPPPVFFGLARIEARLFSTFAIPHNGAFISSSIQDYFREGRVGVSSQFLEDADTYHERYTNVDYFTALLRTAFESVEPAGDSGILNLGSGSGNSAAADRVAARKTAQIETCALRVPVEWWFGICISCFPGRSPWHSLRMRRSFPFVREIERQVAIKHCR